MKIVYNKYIPIKGFGAINLFGIIFARKDYGELSPTDINHEKIHSYQMKELWIIPFYIIYILEWVIRLIQYKKLITAYYNISFEKEAYRQMNNHNYLQNRKRFAFIDYYK